MTLYWRPGRTDVARRRDDPGDGFIYLVNMMPRIEDRFEWLEVTEVFTTVPASRIESAMRTWNGIPDKLPVDFDAFQNALPRGRPSRIEQRKAADKVITQVERKLSKSSYQELLERYGYGTLVVGMPLWFAVPPDDPWRTQNALDDFMTRTALGLEEVKRRVLRRRTCPFRNVIVTWDTTAQAMREWHNSRSAEYEDVANTSLEHPIPPSRWADLSEVLERAVSETAIPENDMPSMNLHVVVRRRKKASGEGPYPKLVKALGEIVRERDESSVRSGKRLTLRVAQALFRLLCFVRIHGIEGLERWVVRRLSVPHAWRARTVRRRLRRLYRESRRRDRLRKGRHG